MRMTGAGRGAPAARAHYQEPNQAISNRIRPVFHRNTVAGDVTGCLAAGDQLCRAKVSFRSHYDRSAENHACQLGRRIGASLRGPRAASPRRKKRRASRRPPCRSAARRRTRPAPSSRTCLGSAAHAAAAARRASAAARPRSILPLARWPLELGRPAVGMGVGGLVSLNGAAPPQSRPCFPDYAVITTDCFKPESERPI